MEGALEVVRGNVVLACESLKAALASRDAAYVSIDAEFSTIGDGINTNDMEMKYAALRAAAKTGAMLQLGVAVWSRPGGHAGTEAPSEAPATATDGDDVDEEDAELRDDDEDEGGEVGEVFERTAAPKVFGWEVRAYDFLLAPHSEFVVNTSTMQFLEDHGFDFGKLFRRGVPTNPKWDEASLAKPPRVGTKEQLGAMQAAVLSMLSPGSPPVVFHNGIADIVFLYQTFVGELPESYQSFCCKVAKRFPKIYDTKYMAFALTTENRTFLSILYRKWERVNEQKRTAGKSWLKIDLVKPDKEQQDASAEALRPPKDDKEKQQCCDYYASKGHCNKGSDCPFSHDIDRILDREEEKHARKEEKIARKRKQKSQSEQEDSAECAEPDAKRLKNGTSPDLAIAAAAAGVAIPQPCETPAVAAIVEPVDVPVPRREMQMHSAAADAYATGFVYAIMLCGMSKDMIDSALDKLFCGGGVPVCFRREQQQKAQPPCAPSSNA
eukprot:m51a1_g14202 hypothetical protein (495) ;mRNA; r:143385-145047